MGAAQSAGEDDPPRDDGGMNMTMETEMDSDGKAEDEAAREPAAARDMTQTQTQTQPQREDADSQSDGSEESSVERPQSSANDDDDDADDDADNDAADIRESVSDILADLEMLTKRTDEAFANIMEIAPQVVQRANDAINGVGAKCVGRKTQRRRASGIEEKFEGVVDELKELKSALSKLEDWLPREGNAEYALHVAITLQYVAVIMSEPVENLQSRARLKNERYHAVYDGVTMRNMIDELRETGEIMWYTTGNLQLLRSHVHGLNEVLEMILHRSASEPGSYVMRVASGEVSAVDNEFVEVVEGLYDEERAMRNLANFFNVLMITNAAVHEFYFEEHHLSRFFSFLRGSMYYGIFKRQRGRHRGEVTFTGLGPDIEKNLKFIQYVWNLPDKRGIRLFYRSGIANVRHSVGFDISERVRARLISAQKVGVLPAKFNDLTARQKAKVQRALVLHFHGGGFVSMSAAAHENYTRRWTKQCNVPIISVDYSLSPDAKFPTAVDEAFEAYRWCREVACKVYQTDRIIVTGDSAGGTLSAAVIIKCIMEGYPGPDGALLAYPAVDIRRAFSPSILWSLNDKLLPYTFLLSCLSAYLGTTDPEGMLKACEDPLASPNVASDEILAQFPPTTIVAAAKDPLFDKSVAFAERLSRLAAKGTARLIIVPGMVHGFLCFKVPVVGVPEVSHLIDMCGDELEKLIVFSNDKVATKVVAAVPVEGIVQVDDAKKTSVVQV